MYALKIGSPEAEAVIKADKELRWQEACEEDKRPYLVEMETISCQTYRVYALNEEEAGDLALAGEAEPVGRDNGTSNILCVKPESP